MKTIKELQEIYVTNYSTIEIFKTLSEEEGIILKSFNDVEENRVMRNNYFAELLSSKKDLQDEILNFISNEDFLTTAYAISKEFKIPIQVIKNFLESKNIILHDKTEFLILSESLTFKELIPAYQELLKVQTSFNTQLREVRGMIRTAAEKVLVEPGAFMKVLDTTIILEESEKASIAKTKIISVLGLEMAKEKFPELFIKTTSIKIK